MNQRPSDPDVAPAAISVGAVFRRALLYGLLTGTIAGTVSATVGLPVIGTMVGWIVGLALSIPVSLIAAAVIAASVRWPGTARGYRRCVDVTLVILVFATAAVAVVWINQRALVGPWPPIAMLATVVVCLVVMRFRLRRLTPVGGP